MDEGANNSSSSASPTDSRLIQILVTETAENNGKIVSPTTPSAHDPALSWNFTGDKLQDDLRMFTTGCFYDCTFNVSNYVTGESKVLFIY
jgi:hypothetical protein